MEKRRTYPTLSSAIIDFIDSYRKQHTRKTYQIAIDYFLDYLKNQNISSSSPPQSISEELMRGYIKYLDQLPGYRGKKELSQTTKEIYVTGIRSLMNHLIYLEVGDGINAARLAQIIKKEGPKRPKRDHIQVDIHAIHLIQEHAKKLHLTAVESHRFPKLKRLQNYRDRALVLSLISTGARIAEEMLPLNRGSIMWEARLAIVIGKGDIEGELLFSKTAIQAINEYLGVRSETDGMSGQPLASLPLFARHDIKCRHKTIRLGYTSAYRALRQLAEKALVDYGQVKFNPHMFRHYFVTNIIQATGGDIDMARSLARHSSTSVTSRYMHTAMGDKRAIHDDAFD